MTPEQSKGVTKSLKVINSIALKISYLTVFLLISSGVISHFCKLENKAPELVRSKHFVLLRSLNS